MQDKMTPTEKVVFSRIKECYNLKTNLKDWKNFLKFLETSKSQIKVVNSIDPLQKTNKITKIL